MCATRKPPRSWTGKPANSTANEAPGAAPGTYLSDFAFPDLQGRTVRVSDQLGHAYLLLFVNRDCKYSQAALRELGRLRRKDDPALLPAIVTVSGGEQAARSVALEHGLGDDVVFQEGQELLRFYRVPATPAAYRVDETRRTVGHLAIGSHDVIGLLRGKLTTVNTRNRQPGGADSSPVVKERKVQLHTGDPVPNVALAAPEGYSIDLHASLGRLLLVLFWSEQCPWCSDIIAAIDTLSGRPDAPAILLIGKDGDSRPSGLPGVIFGTQDRRSASMAFGLHQIPSAVLVGPAGRLDRQPAEGKTPVLELVRSL